MEKIVKFIKSQPVLVIAFIAALITVFIIPPDMQYPGYINYAVLIQLFALMAAVAGLRSINVFEVLTSFMLRSAGTVRRLGQIFIIICFFTSMVVTNDVALLTFVPLTLLCMSKADEKDLILAIVLETAAANMGSMMTPVGNPQNLFIYAEYGLTAEQFVKTTAPYGILSLVLLQLMTFLLSNKECTVPNEKPPAVDMRLMAVYAAMFIVALLSVFKVIPPVICLIITAAAMFIADRKLFLKVDYALLATFVCFFVFVGNIARIEAVGEFFGKIMDGREVIVSVILSQVISNVPAAVMLSGFTDKGNLLLLGVDLGGLGTIIASLASLISFQFYRKSENAKAGKYILVFSAVNFAMLAVMLIVNTIIG